MNANIPSELLYLPFFEGTCLFTSIELYSSGPSKVSHWLLPQHSSIRAVRLVWFHCPVAWRPTLKRLTSEKQTHARSATSCDFSWAPSWRTVLSASVRIRSRKYSTKTWNAGDSQHQREASQLSSQGLLILNQIWRCLKITESTPGKDRLNKIKFRDTHFAKVTPKVVSRTMLSQYLKWAATEQLNPVLHIFGQLVQLVAGAQ